MASRRKVALIYKYNENWIGGTYYIQNLISALDVVPDESKPHLVILCEQEAEYNSLVSLTGYPYIERRNIWKQLNTPVKAINKLSRRIFDRNIINPYSMSKDLDLVVLQEVLDGAFKTNQKLLYWIPDFQDRYLPEFFTSEDLNYLKRIQRRIVDTASYIVFSSYVAEKDFDKFYPRHSLTSFVMQFAVTHRLAVNVSVENLIEKYSLPQHFYICSNQFWQHKNHKVVLEAISLLKQQGKNVFVAFTGKEHDSRYPKYFEDLQALSTKLDVTQNIKFLGFISRQDQLGLMKRSVAAIQPSLFEGWSTVIEDAKALNTPVICSDLDVHKEQLEHYPSRRFFSVSTGASDLAKVIDDYQYPGDTYYDYAEDIKNYGNALLTIIKKITTAI